MQLGTKQIASIENEKTIVGGLNGLQVSAKLGQATEELHRHYAKYHKLFEEWCADGSLVELKNVVSSAKAQFATQDDDDTLQPNPWKGNGIMVTSKRYLARVITVYNGTGAKYDVLVDPVSNAVAVCDRIVAQFGAGVKLVTGPPKKEQRIMEKAHDGNYARIRDLGRLSLIVDHISLMPGVMRALSDCQDFEVVRIKNRLDPGHEALDSAGYRDVQVLVREPQGGWIVEIQVIPTKMYELKTSCGHTGYAKYRFILEVCKRARVQQAVKAFRAANSAGIKRKAAAAVLAAAAAATRAATAAAAGVAADAGSPTAIVNTAKVPDTHPLPPVRAASARVHAPRTAVFAANMTKAKHGRNAVHPLTVEAVLE